MAKYAIWDKESDIFTLGRDKRGKAQWTAQEYIAEYAPWAANPNVKVIVGGGAINGTVFMEYEATVEFYKQQGAEITEDMTAEQALEAIEAFENRVPEQEPTAEERIAAALEFQNILNL